MHALGVQVCDDAYFVFLIVNKFALTVVTLNDSLRACQTSIESASLDGVRVKN